jgi:hypothetical protein
VATFLHPSEVTFIVARHVERHFDMSLAVSALTEAGANVRMTGGVVRSALLGHESYNDLDLIVDGTGGDVVRCFRELGLEQTKTRYGGTRFYWNRLPIDLIETAPETPFEQGIAMVLASFDLDINAVAVDITTGAVSAVPSALESLAARRARLISTAWHGSQIVIANQCIRLAKLLFEVGDLTLSAEDAAFLTAEIIPHLASTDWASLRSRFPHGPTRLAELLTSQLTRVQAGGER